MRLYQAGSGPALIVLPGIQGRWEWLRPALAQLQTRCTTVSYSLCGDFGSGCRLDSGRGFESYMDQLDRVFDAARLERAAVCGISYGGFLALRYAATRPERVTALVLTSSPSPGWEPNPVQRSYLEHPLRATPRFVLTSPLRIWPEIKAAFPSIPDRIAFLAGHGFRVATAPMKPALMASRIRQQQQIDFCPDCALVRVPTLVVTGEPHLDRIVPAENTMQYVEMIPGATHYRLERTGHLGLLTRPELYAAVVGDFVQRHAVTIRS
jgi:pimeloyl-ACP methyl ester carboxylesterase